MHDRVFQVKSIVIDIPEENIIIALHDNEYDVEKACESLLDSSGSSKVLIIFSPNNYYFIHSFRMNGQPWLQQRRIKSVQTHLH